MSAVRQAPISMFKRVAMGVNVAMLILVGVAAVLLLWGPYRAGSAICPATPGPYSPFDFCRAARPLVTDHLTIHQDLTLEANHVGSITVGADGVTLDCAGHEVLGTTGVGIYLHGKRGVTIENCEVRGFLTGVAVLNSTQITVSNNIARANHTGFQLSLSSSVQLTNNVADVNSSGFVVTRSDGNLVEGNTTNRGYTGISLTDSAGNTIRGNEINHAFESSLRLDGAAANTVAANVIISSKAIGISIGGSQNLVAGNFVTGPHGVLIEGADNTFDNNTVTDADTGIELRGATGNTFTGNQFLATGHAIKLNRKSVDNQFAGNDLSDARAAVVGAQVAAENTFTDNSGLDLPEPLILTENHQLSEDHEGPVVFAADGITLDCAGHKVSARNGGKSWEDRAWTGIRVSNRRGITIENCVTEGFQGGISVSDSSEVTIRGNESLITLVDSEDNRIIDNNNVTGINLLRSSRNVLEGNHVVDGGISLTGAQDNQVIGNHVIDETLQLTRSDRNQIERNDVTLSIELIRSDKNLVAENTISGRGVSLFRSHDNAVAQNAVPAVALISARRNVVANNLVGGDTDQNDPSVGSEVAHNGIIGLSNSHSNSVVGNVVTGAGIAAWRSGPNTFEANTLTGGPILLKNKSNGNTVTSNVVQDAEFGFRVVESHENNFTGNSATDNAVGFRISRAHDNIFRANVVTGDGEPLKITGDETRTYGNVFADNIGFSAS